MIIDDALISKLERLSRLKLSEEERKNIQKDLNSILQMFDKLSEIDTEGVEPLTYVLEEHQPPLREDKVADEFSNSEALKNASKKEEPFFIVPKFLNKKK